MASTPSITSSARIASPYLSPHIAMMRHKSPISFVPLSTKDAKRKRRVKKRGDKDEKRKSKDGSKHRTSKRRPYFDPTHPHKLTSRQWIVYIMYCWGFFALGIFTSAPGPILPTLEAQVNVSLAVISFIFSARAIGFVIGSMVSGYVMDRWQKYLISTENGTKFLLQKNQNIADYLWSLPRWNWCPMSAHNVFTISLIIAAITNAGVPYVTSVYALAVLVSINGICFGNINTFGNVLLLTLFDIEISRDIDFDLIYHESLINVAQKDGKDDNDSSNSNTDDENQELIEESVSVSYGSLSRDDPAEATMVRMIKQDERVGPFMQFLQAIYALGGFLAPIFIQISFEISGDYAYAFWFFTLLYIPPGIVLIFYPEPVRMSVISERLKEIEKVNRSTRSLLSEGGTDIGEEEADPVEELRRRNKKLWANVLCFGFAVFLLWYVGAQVGYGMYVTTYAIDYLNTSDAIGRYLASANWLGLFVGRFVAVPLSQKMSALNMVRVDLMGMILGCFLLFFSLDWEYAVWISSVVVGFCMASVWPSMFVWAETMIPVTGIFASIMCGGGSLGEFVIPALQGNIMAFFGSQYFAHVMFAMSIFLLLNLFVNQIVAKRLMAFI